MLLQHIHRPPQKKLVDRSPLLILLHGIGADKHDLFGLAPFLDERFFIVSARAPYALPYGGYAWFELYIKPEDISINVEQFEKSKAILLEFINLIVCEYNLDPNLVYLCGFSQGAIMSLSIALANPEKFAGIVAMSGRATTEMLPEQKDFGKFKDFPVFVAHGIYDTVLPIDKGRETKEILSQLPVDLEYKEYEMAHEISQASLEDMSEWLKKRLNNLD